MKSGSLGQNIVYALTIKLFPSYKIIWEQVIKSINCRFDIFIKEIGLAIEIDGTQHDTYNKFFHKDEADAKMAYQRDQKKNDFCEMNGIKLIRIKYKQALTMTESTLSTLIEQQDYPKSVYTYSCLN